MNNGIIHWGIDFIKNIEQLLCSSVNVKWSACEIMIKRSTIFCIFVHEFLVFWVCVPWVMRDEYGRCTALLAMHWVMVKAHRCDVLLWQCEPGVYWDIRICQGERDALVNWGLDLSFSLKYITKSLRQHDSTGNTCRYIQTGDIFFLPHHHLANRVENSQDGMLQCLGYKFLCWTGIVSQDEFVMHHRLWNNLLINKV